MKTAVKKLTKISIFYFALSIYRYRIDISTSLNWSHIAYRSRNGSITSSGYVYVRNVLCASVVWLTIRICFPLFEHARKLRNVNGKVVEIFNKGRFLLQLKRKKNTKLRPLLFSKYVENRLEFWKKANFGRTRFCLSRPVTSTYVIIFQKFLVEEKFLVLSPNFIPGGVAIFSKRGYLHIIFLIAHG